MSLKPHRLLLILAVLLVLPSWSRAAGAADLKGALAYVPKDSVGVMTIDVGGVRTTPIFQKLVEAVFKSKPRAKTNLDELKKKTGFDPLKDVHGLVMAAGPGFPADDDDFLVIAEAKLDEARLIAFMQKEGAKLTPKSDALGKWYLLDDDGAMAFRGKYVVVGGIDIFRRALKKQGPTPALSAALAPNLSKHLAFAVEPNGAMRTELQKEMPELGQLQRFSGGASLENGLDIRTVATFATAAPPAKLAKEANEGLAKLKQDKGVKQMGLASLLDRIKIRAARTDLHLDVVLTQADLDKLTKLLDQLM